MYSLKRNELEILAAILALLFVYLLLGKIHLGEHAEGFYIVRPTYWKATPTKLTIEFTSFYPSNLTCEINTPYGSVTKEIAPRSSIMVEFNGSFSPNTFVQIPISIDCGYVKEEGKIYAFVFT